MRMRFFTGMVLLGLAGVGSLVCIARLSARDAVVPSPAPSEAPQTCPASHLQCGGQVYDKVPTMLVNARKIRLNYSVSDVGPSGVSAVELWATRDGRTWQRYSNEPPPAGPLVVHVAEEGRYGFSIVVKSGVGLKSSTPETGDAPQLWVEVDETRPTVYVKDVRLGKGGDLGSLNIQYAANDANLACRPVTISMSTTREGPWTPIASGLENTGSYVWTMPKDVPYQFYVKVEATDRAGNMGSCCYHDPVKVDLTRPKGTILGVDGDRKPVTKTEPVQGMFIGYTR
ncbi:MAG: hypothetical protein U0840_05525 [Gemmataceae bacterium]